MPNPNPPLQLSYWFAVYSISSRKRCSEKKCNQYHVCFADQKNISDSMTWKILMQPIIFCGVANLVEETEMIFFLGKQSNTCYVQELNILWSFMLSYSNPSHKIWFFCRKLYYYILTLEYGGGPLVRRSPVISHRIILWSQKFLILSIKVPTRRESSHFFTILTDFFEI